MKSYRYDKTRYFMQVTLNSILCSVLALIALVMMMNGFMILLMAVIVLVCAYTVLNSLIAKVTPEIIVMGEDSIALIAYGKERKYSFNDLKMFKIREFPSSGKMYIRVNDYNLFRGRYWVQTRMFDEGKELFMSLLDLEYKLHPETLKARARRVNTQYNRKAARHKNVEVKNV